MSTCEIQWIDANGTPTPDENPPIGVCRVKAHKVEHSCGYTKVEASRWYRICADHAKRMPEKEWEFLPWRTCGSQPSPDPWLAAHPLIESECP
jgi:hypothetical protein